jgi:hypothetical protein
MNNQKIYCNRCSCDTEHEYIYQHYIKNTDDERTYFEAEIHSTLSCLKCREIVFEHLHYNGSECDYEQYYPQRNNQKILPNRSIQNSDSLRAMLNREKYKLERLYTEILNAYNARAYILSTIGIRALLEGICNDQNIHERNLKEQIKKLLELDPFKNVNFKSIDLIREHGNESAHELLELERSTIRIMLDILERIIEVLKTPDSVKKSEKLEEKCNLLNQINIQAYQPQVSIDLSPNDDL